MEIPSQIPIMTISDQSTTVGTLSKGEQRRKDLLQLPVIQVEKWVKMNIGKNLRDSETFFELMTIIYDIQVTDDTPVFYPLTVIILMLSMTMKKQFSEV